MPGTALGARATSMDKTNKIASFVIYILFWGGRQIKIGHVVINDMNINHTGQESIKSQKL